MNEGPRRRTLTISDSFRVRRIHSSFHLQSYRTPVPHVILTLNIIREAENLVPNQWQKVTDTQQHRPVIGQRFCGSNPLSTVVNLLHCCYLQIQLTAHPEPRRAPSNTAAYQELHNFSSQDSVWLK